MFKQILSLGAAAVLCLHASSFSAEWLNDMSTAREQAAQQNKAIFVNFTGSDWCGYCMELKKNVLSTPEFEAYADDKLILLEVDIPRAPLPPAIRSTREQLCRDYGVRAFPTCLVLSADGEIWGGFSGSRPSVHSATVILDEALTRGQQLKEARKLSGEQRAAALYNIYQELPRNLRVAADTLEKEITDNDPKDTLGLRAKLAADKQMRELMTEVQAYHRNFRKQTEIFERYLAKALPGNEERIMERKRTIVVFPSLNVMLLNAQNTKDIEQAKEYILREAAISYPESIRAEMIRSLEATFSDPQALLQKAQSMKKRAR